MMVSFVLSGLLMGGAFPSWSGSLQDDAGPAPVLPGQAGYVLKRARELVALSQCRDAEARTEILLAQSRERLREREALGRGPWTPEGVSVVRGLAESYRLLALDGGTGTIECGVAEGREMQGAQKRYLEQIRGQHERWVLVVSARPPGEREEEKAALRVVEEAPERSRSAQEAGLDFLRKERARREAAASRTPGSAEAPRPPVPPAPPGSAPEASKLDADHPGKDGGENGHPSEHHPPHAHRPHR